MPSALSLPPLPHSSYADRLAAHIDAYLETVIAYPAVRHGEFAALRDHAALVAPRRLLEVPAEGHMLDRLYPGADIVRADFLRVGVAGYAETVAITDWGLAGMGESCFDGVLSVVPMHHASAPEKRAYLQGARRVLRPGGVLAFGEVEADSPEHRFLDGFVARHTPTGHTGMYPSAAFATVLENQGFTAVTTARRPCPWVFASEASLYQYLTRLFALEDVPPQQLLEAVEQQLGLQAGPDGTVAMAWSLRYFRGAREAT